MKKKQNYVGDMMKMGVANIVGTGLISATAESVSTIPAGTAKTVAGIVPGLQSVSLVGHNLGMVNKSFGHKSKGSNNLKTKKIKW